LLYKIFESEINVETNHLHAVTSTNNAIRDILLYFIVLSLLVLQAIRQYIIEVTPLLWVCSVPQFSTNANPKPTMPLYHFAANVKDAKFTMIEHEIFSID